MYEYKHNIYDKMLFEDFKKSPHAEYYDQMFLLSLELMSLEDLESIKKQDGAQKKKCIFVSMSEPQWYDEGATISKQWNKLIELLRQKQIFNTDFYVPCFGDEYHSDLDVLNQNHYGWVFLKYSVDLPFANNDILDVKNQELSNYSNFDLIQYKFLHMNFTHRMHRQLFSKFLIKENLLDDNCVAINTGQNETVDAIHYESHSNLFGSKSCLPVDHRDDWQYSKNLLDLWAGTPLTDHKHPAIDQNYSRASYDFCKLGAVYVVSETAFNHPYPNFSEKTTSALLSNRPFVIIGAYGSLRTLKEKGYKTFDDFIDESYDTIKDPNQRMEQIFNTVKKINQKPLSELVTHVESSADKFLHNSTLLLDTLRKYVTNLDLKKEIENVS